MFPDIARSSERTACSAPSFFIVMMTDVRLLRVATRRGTR
jgi:hypothetical protein